MYKMKYLVIFFLFFSFTVSSQANGKIYFRNGKTFEGKIEIDDPVTTGEAPAKIHYYPTSDTKLTKGFSDIYKVEAFRAIKNEKKTVTYYFKKFKNRELFLTKLQSYKNFEVYLGRELKSSDFTPGFGLPSTGSIWYEDVFYIGKKYSFRLEKLHKHVASKKFKGLLSKYTSDCNNVDAIVTKYQKNRKLKKRDLFQELTSVCN